MKTAEQISMELTEFNKLDFFLQVGQIKTALLKWESEIRDDQRKKTLESGLFGKSEK